MVLSIRALGTAEIRELDRRTIEELGIPGLILMENAGRACAEEAEKLARTSSCDGIWVVCGKGNNGADGLVAARHLANRGLDVRVSLLAGSAIAGDRSDAALNRSAADASGVAVRYAEDLDPVEELSRTGFRRPLVMDALLGTGLKGSVRPPFRGWLEFLGQQGHPVIAVDTPSGLDSDTGEILGVALPATRTVTFAVAKKGFFLASGPRLVGQLSVVDISIPRFLIDAALEQGGP